MPLFGSFRIGRWFGFPIRIDYSWFLVAALVIWTFSTREFPRVLPFYPASTYLAMGTAAAILFFLSVLLHELGHALVGRMRGVTVESITLFIFGGIAQARDEARRPLDEFLLTAAGPLASLALAGLFLGARIAAEAVAAPPPVVTVLGFLALLNFILAIFNMIPGFPLDGGRIFRSIVWAATGDLVRATRWATRGGRLFGAALIVLGVFNLSRGQMISGLWAALIGWFVVNAATSSLRHFELRHLLRQIPVGAVMDPRPRTIEASLPVDRAISEYFLRGNQEAYPVERDGGLIGIVDLRAVSEISVNLRPGTPVSAVTRPADEFPAASPDEALVEALSRAQAGVSSLLVTHNGYVVGVLDPREVAVRVRRMQRLGLVSPGGAAAPGDQVGTYVPSPPAKSA
ncbi:M50 family metallopeptidase [Candidatus Palauibacter sp.]|uniref:M50 family metallopeptidase n=1 Tax=Candidatus Palauibacter sp. TaxID=3101350 RepID=UPI003B590A3E